MPHPHLLLLFPRSPLFFSRSSVLFVAEGLGPIIMGFNSTVHREEVYYLNTCIQIGISDLVFSVLLLAVSSRLVLISRGYDDGILERIERGTVLMDRISQSEAKNRSTRARHNSGLNKGKYGGC